MIIRYHTIWDISVSESLIVHIKVNGIQIAPRVEHTYNGFVCTPVAIEQL